MAIFLIGGPSINDKPSAVFLRSGDIAIMSRSSRLSYHAVPRIMKSDIPNSWQSIECNSHADVEDQLDAASQTKRRKIQCEESVSNIELVKLANIDEKLWTTILDDVSWQPFDQYVSGCRININVRQVLRSGQSTLNDQSEKDYVHSYNSSIKLNI